MNLWRRQQKALPMGGTIGYYQLTDWWFSAFTPDERLYIDRNYQPWGERPHCLTEGHVAYTRKTIALHLSEITRYLRRPEDLDLVRRILDKAEQEAIVQGDIQGLDAVYTALMRALHGLGSNERYMTSIGRKARTQWH